MTFRFTSDKGTSLTARLVTIGEHSGHPEQVVLIKTSGVKSPALYVPLNRIDELLTGIKEVARQATA
ncbi:hypothetical protein [Streptomyces anulatus]|uniref:hypothetical protein n=1 Tax=Streptomyces anulatus TaxID=1892 RepID=UPI00343832D6